MFYLEFFLDLSPEVVPELLQLLGQRRVREVSLDSVLDAQLIQQRQAEVVLEGKRLNELIEKNVEVRCDGVNKLFEKKYLNKLAENNHIMSRYDSMI